MYKMIIADDEPSTRQGIRSAVNWTLLNIEIVGEAGNGLEALELVRERQPDILACDIRMPKMDGITLAARLQAEQPGLQIIFLSGYSDKEYLKTAIRLSAVDYLYKPFELEELIAAVKKAKENCGRQQKPRYQSSDLALQLLDLPTAGQPMDLLKETGIDPNGRFITLVIRLNSNVSVFQDIDEWRKEALDVQFMASRYLETLHEKSLRLFGPALALSQVGNGFIMHVNLPENISEPMVIQNRAEQVLHVFEPVLDHLACGISDLANGLENLKTAFIQARKAARAALLLGHGQLIAFAGLSEQKFTHWPDFDARLSQAMDAGQAAAAGDLLRNYVRHMQACTSDDILNMKDELTRIALAVHQKLKSRQVQDLGYVSEIIQSAAEIREIEGYIGKLLEDYFSEIVRLDSSGRIVYEAERYIRGNIENKDLSIQRIADHVYVTPTYLCAIYKRKTGHTINQFILENKMKRARELLADTSLRLGDIAARLGYANQNYFSRTFAGYFGVKPSTFRNKTL